MASFWAGDWLGVSLGVACGNAAEPVVAAGTFSGVGVGVGSTADGSGVGLAESSGVGVGSIFGEGWVGIAVSGVDWTVRTAALSVAGCTVGSAEARVLRSPVGGLAWFVFSATTVCWALFTLADDPPIRCSNPSIEPLTFLYSCSIRTLRTGS